jgi:hypothetical protein
VVTIQERRRKPSVLRLLHEVQVLRENSAQHNVQREIETWDVSEKSKNINWRNLLTELTDVNRTGPATTWLVMTDRSQ